MLKEERKEDGFANESISSAKHRRELEISSALATLREAMKNRKYEYAVAGYRALADEGVPEALVEYGKILEAGELVPRDLDLAMKCFYRAAEMCNPVGAFRYSRLVSRHSDAASRFWLAFAAHIGSKEAYPSVAEQYSSEGDEVMANYYYSLAALGDDVHAIVTLAKRYYNGIGSEPREDFARWYMDKLTFPPFHAIKLAYKLRGVKPSEPKVEKPKGYADVVERLMKDAKKMKFFTAYHTLLKEVCEWNYGELYFLGVSYAEGIGCEESIDEAISAFERAAAHGSADACKYLGDIYISEKTGKRSVNDAMRYYRAAAERGLSNAYELMGDIFYEGKLIECDIAAAIELYELAAREGDASATRKANALKAEREELYSDGERTMESNPESAFRFFAISAGMGYIPAYSKIAYCYEVGIGCKKDRRRAHLWYTEALEGEDYSVLYDLGRCYSRGIGVAFDFDRAVGFLKRAARHGDVRATSELERLLENKRRHLSRSLFSSAMRLLYKKKFKPALKMLEACRRSENPRGIYTLGCLYEFGIGTETNRELAFSLYEIAYSMKFRDPRQTYKQKILKMVR